MDPHSESELGQLGSRPGLGSQAKCEASMKEKLDLWKQFKDSKFEKNTVIFTNNNSSMTYVCLPEPKIRANKPNPRSREVSHWLVVDQSQFVIIELPPSKLGEYRVGLVSSARLDIHISEG
jgi:hypothetical protein